MILGIDASSFFRRGGGLTHLCQVLAVARPAQYGIEKIVVWGSQNCIQDLLARPWLSLVHQPELDGPLYKRVLWRQRHLPGLLRDSRCDVLFAPGGVVPRTINCPGVAMCHNLLPFDRREASRYGLSLNRLRLYLLLGGLKSSFQKAAGIVFLTHYAREFVLPQLARIPRWVCVIPHGIDERFRLAPRPQKSLVSYSREAPFRLLYVSVVREFKHQWHVAEAVTKLWKAGLPVVVDFVGRADPGALAKFNAIRYSRDPEGEFLFYKGFIPYQDLHNQYHRADAFVFASSCENLPIILLEAMGAGLPIACSDRGPMPEILGDAGLYFDPEDSQAIANALRELLENPLLRQQLAAKAFEKAGSYSWERCADETLELISQVFAGKGGACG